MDSGSLQLAHGIEYAHIGRHHYQTVEVIVGAADLKIEKTKDKQEE